MTLSTGAFDRPDHLAAKADPALIAADEQRFAALADSLRQSIADLSGRLDTERRAPGGAGQAAPDRDLEVHRLTARLRSLRRFGVDLCPGRIVGAEDPEPVYVGRLGRTDSTGRRLLVDWRSPAAEPFFAATHADPMGLVSRRRHRWTRSRITDYWDEVFTADGSAGHTALDDQSAFLASLGGDRSAGCATCPAPSGPTRTRSSARAPGAPSSSTAAGHRADRRRPAPLGLPPLRPPAWARTAAACSSWGGRHDRDQPQQPRLSPTPAPARGPGRVSR